MKPIAMTLILLTLTAFGANMAIAADDTSAEPAPLSQYEAPPAGNGQSTPDADVNRFRMDLSLSLLNIDFYDNLDDDLDGVSAITAGPLRAPLGIGIGGSIGNHVSLGCRFLLGFTARDYDVETSGTYFEYKILPYIEIAFGHRRVKPFIVFSTGVGGYVSNYKYGDDYESDSSSVQFLFGVGGGVHIFFGEHASLDFWEFETIGVGKETEEWSDEDTVEDFLVLTSSADLFIGLTIWI